MMQDPADLVASVTDWIAGWGREVAAVDLAAGRRRFDHAVVAFGTRADVVHGLDALHDEQWSRVWPTIREFAFDVDQLAVQASPDGLLAVAIVPWSSTGLSPDGAPFDRPGRATVVLVRDDVSGPWRATHTHFSLAAGVPPTSHGHRPPAS